MISRRKCAFCGYSRLLRYTSGEYAIKCAHPDVDGSTTGDIRILEECPLTKRFDDESRKTH